MQLDVSTVVALLAIVVSAGTTIVLAIRGYSVSTRDAEVNRRIAALEQQQQFLTNQLHDDQMETVRLQGEVALVKQQHGHFERSVDSLGRLIEDVPRREEWENRMAGIEAQLANLTKILTGRTQTPVPRPESHSPGRYGGGEPGGTRR